MKDTKIERLKSVLLFLCIDFIRSYLVFIVKYLKKNFQFNVLVHNAVPICQAVQQYYLFLLTM